MFFSSTWHAALSYSGALVKIDSTDEHFCRDCSYYVSVFGRSDSDFTVLVTTTDAKVALQEGVPVQSFNSEKRYQYYSYHCDQKDVEVAIILTTITGDSDLYVSTKGYGNNTDAEFSSAQFGSDAIATINKGPTTYYISVFTFLNSTYTVTVYVNYPNSTAETTLLVSGVPQNGFLDPKTYKYYTIHVTGEHKDLQISTTRFVGDPDLYVSKDGTDPTKEKSQWSSAVYGKDSVTIENPEPGDYKIGVYAYSLCYFSITASLTNTIETLSDGVSFTKDLKAEEWEYFRIPIDSTDKDLTVTVTPYGNGDPVGHIGHLYTHTCAIDRRC